MKRANDVSVSFTFFGAMSVSTGTDVRFFKLTHAEGFTNVRFSSRSRISMKIKVPIHYQIFRALRLFIGRSDVSKKAGQKLSKSECTNTETHLCFKSVQINTKPRFKITPAALVLSNSLLFIFVKRHKAPATFLTPKKPMSMMETIMPWLRDNTSYMLILKQA